MADDKSIPWHRILINKHRLAKTIPSTLLKLTAKAPENGWLEDYFPFGKAYFQVPCYF